MAQSLGWPRRICGNEGHPAEHGHQGEEVANSLQSNYWYDKVPTRKCSSYTKCTHAYRYTSNLAKRFQDQDYSWDSSKWSLKHQNLKTQPDSLQREQVFSIPYTQVEINVMIITYIMGRTNVCWAISSAPGTTKCLYIISHWILTLSLWNKATVKIPALSIGHGKSRIESAWAGLAQPAETEQDLNTLVLSGPAQGSGRKFFSIKFFLIYILASIGL